ncbi:carbohydrate ABC transporter permease [Paenibacillus piri]|uniref:Carbohydrate ABC transporter permease n=1 Tax=Paenibacillus piri TaxID=2547395 RepID=A0A4V2ZUE5_9BACL|nr:carbohydrate ABC transporter permease [Paenibacillus piri]TDG00705.1 carbohydrate ABC transporter permease [Paenibacillus piri]
MNRRTKGQKAFDIVNHVLLIGLALLCILPLIHVIAQSFSASSAVTAGFVKFWPVRFTLKSYEYVLSKPEFLMSVGVTLKRVVLGVCINLLLTIMTAYPLSKEASQFKYRTIYVWFFVITMLFHGGLVPTYMLIKQAGIINTIWALILPGAVPVFSVVLMLNFMRGLPKEIEESAFIDGAGIWTTLWKIIVPISMPSIATITLFSIVGHWNSWFDGLIYMNRTENYPLQTYLRSVVINLDLSLSTTVDYTMLKDISDQTQKAAQIVLGSLPILCVYPFLQRFFMKGIIMGSVKE